MLLKLQYILATLLFKQLNRAHKNLIFKKSLQRVYDLTVHA